MGKRIWENGEIKLLSFEICVGNCVNQDKGVRKLLNFFDGKVKSKKN